MKDEIEFTRIRNNLNKEFVILGEIRDRGRPELQKTIEMLGSVLIEINKL
jgi:hypothetical protein